MAAVIHFGWWRSKTDVESDFDVTIPGDQEILFAIYGYNGDTGGEAFVLLRQGETLLEVNAWHCSCTCLEGDWNPESTTISALRYIAENGTKFRYHEVEARAAFIALIERLGS